MSTFVLIGGPFEIYDTPHKGDVHLFHCTLGAQFEIAEEVGRCAIADGAALLPKDAFDAVGFTADELAKYPNAKKQSEAPKDVQAKLLAARIALHDYRAQLAAAPPAPAEGTKEV